MKHKMLLAVATAAALWTGAALAVPAVADVTATVRAGDYPKAESQMREVLAANPNSAKAHYILAEILSKEHRFPEASTEAAKARELDPTLKFASSPEQFRTFESELSRERPSNVGGGQVAPTRMSNTAPMAPAPVQAASSGIPGWVWIGGIALVAFLIFRAVSRRAIANNMANAGGQGGYGMNPGMPQPGYGPAGYGQGFGQSAGGGLLRTGLAAGAGVAGGMLLERMLEGNRHEDNTGGGNYGSQGGNFNDADAATRQLDDRPMDFGGGGNDWGNDGGGGGGDNFTPSGGGDDGGW